jgi:hypothetical protein
MPPGEKAIDPRNHGKLPDPNAIELEFAAPFVIAERGKRLFLPWRMRVGAYTEQAHKLIVPVGVNFHIDRDRFVHDPLHGKLAIVHARAEICDHDPAATFDRQSDIHAGT